MKTIHDNLRMLNVMVASSAHDVEKYLDDPTVFIAPEYFVDVLEALNQAQGLVVEIRNQLGKDSK